MSIATESTTDATALTVHVTHVLPGPFDGHTPYSSYADRFWTPILGPTCMLAWRRLVDRHPQADVDLAEFAAEIGVPQHFGRTLDRLVRFGVASWGSDGSYWVAAALPELKPRQVERLPASLAAEHADYLASKAALEDAVTPQPARCGGCDGSGVRIRSGLPLTRCGACAGTGQVAP